MRCRSPYTEAMKKITINRTTFRLYKKGSSTPIRLRSHTGSNLILVEGETSSG